jgi:hypothetical protein
MKHSNYFFIFFLSFLSMRIKCDFTDLWHDMQNQYNKLIYALEKNNFFEIDTIAIHPYWHSTQNKIKQMILGEPNPSFLDFPPIAGTMVRQGMGIPQSYEVLYLNYCINTKLHEEISQIKESSVAKLKNECSQYTCSVNTLGHLFIAAKVLEIHDKELNIIVEFGSGYGNLAYILKTIRPEITLFLIDLPELLAIQLLFLKSSLPDCRITLYDSPAEVYEPGSINLIPIQLLPQFEIKADAFISTMALSESTTWTQEQISTKKFFQAQTVYITGQINGWGAQHNFVNHSFIINEIKKNYQHVVLQPLHFVMEGLCSYEILAYLS